MNILDWQNEGISNERDTIIKKWLEENFKGAIFS